MVKQELLDYITFTRKTAVYPNSVEIPYLTLGLINETAELRNAPNSVHELGDIMWYTARLADALGETDLFAKHFTQEFVAITRPWGNWVEGGEYVLGLLGQFAGRVKKYLRGDEIAFRKMRASYHHEVLTAVSFMILEAEVDLGEVITKNIEKLTARKEAGTLKGDGDDR